MKMIQTRIFVYIDDHFERYNDKVACSSPLLFFGKHISSIDIDNENHIFHVLIHTCACYTGNAIGEPYQRINS